MAELPPPPDGEWAELGACADQPMADFFEAHSHKQVRAFAICSFCPVQLQCLEYAITNRIDDGIWGGTNKQDRKAVGWDLAKAIKRAERRLRGDLSDATVRQKLYAERRTIR